MIWISYLGHIQILVISHNYGEFTIFSGTTRYVYGHFNVANCQLLPEGIMIIIYPRFMVKNHHWNQGDFFFSEGLPCQNETISGLKPTLFGDAFAESPMEDSLSNDNAITCSVSQYQPSRNLLHIAIEPGSQIQLIYRT